MIIIILKVPVPISIQSTDIDLILLGARYSSTHFNTFTHTWGEGWGLSGTDETYGQK